MKKISTNELSDQAYSKVRSMILSHELVPGQKIVQDKLAENLGISRTPLRAGLLKLESEGLIESLPRKGVIVKEFSDKEILEIYDCRIALEGTAIRLFTNKATQKDIDDLKALFHPFIEGEIDKVKYQKADARFHDTIMKKSGNRFLYNLFKQGTLQVCIELIGLLRPPEETLEEHMAIIEAMEKKDTNLVESLAKIHLENTKEMILKGKHG